MPPAIAAFVLRKTAKPHNAGKERMMKLAGHQLESKMLPIAGVLSLVLVAMAVCGVVTMAFDFSFGGLERPIIGFGMFAAGVLLSRHIPVWREATEVEHGRLKRALENSPFAPWLGLAKHYGWSRTLAVFALVCAGLLWLVI